MKFNDLEYVINVGTAGSLNEKIEIGDVVIAEKLVQHDFDVTAAGREKGYITDIGMTGAIFSVLGRERNSIVQRFVTGLPQKHEIADGKSELCGIIFDIDEESGKTISLERVKIV